jgi:hypothetical protein
MSGAPMRRRPRRAFLVVSLVGVAAVSAVTAGSIQAGPTTVSVAVAGTASPKVSKAKAFDISMPLRELAKQARSVKAPEAHPNPRVDRNITKAGGSSAGSVIAAGAGSSGSAGTLAVGATLANFEGLSNQDNFNVFGFRVNPPDPVGDVGPNHYVEMINLVFGVYSKTGTLLLGPIDTGTLWAGFPIEDCTDPSGDPIVVYDQFADRWILSQFTTRGLDDPTGQAPFYNCVAISQTPDPTGAYFRYAFTTGNFFPDYPKYGIWKDTYVITTREFGPTVEYGIGVYAIDRNKVIAGDPNAQVVSFFLDGNDPDILPLVGDGLLPADVDGTTKPKQDVPIPIVGTQDNDFPYGATFDALNIWELDVHWNANAETDATLELATQLATAPFDSVFPCNGVPGVARDCLPQPGIANVAQFLDILSYRQRPTWRLAWRGFKNYDSMVTTQSVEAAGVTAGMRWYEIRRSGSGTYTIHQQGTVAPGDGIHRWMGSIAQDKNGAMALGYSVVNATTVFPGIRYTGRVAGDPLGTMPQGEGTVINGTGVQTTTNSRWGDYTSMNVDPVDDCTFWYVNEYYTAAGQASSPAGWQTRIASFKLPGC